jgi:hypothetical protein
MENRDGISQVFLTVYEETQQVEYSLNGSTLHLLNAMIHVLKTKEEFSELFCKAVDCYRKELIEGN